MNKYDALYIFVGAAKEETLDKAIEKAQAEITRLGGTILDTSNLGKRTFARLLAKRDSGTYVRVRFEMDPAKIEELTRRYHLVEDVFRVQILAVDERREAQLAKQAAQRAARAAAAEAEAENADDEDDE
ncbi:MAG: 30S ribosomal protein S6 [Kiritimatiellia bacterium]|jgi:ribosomal protein S6